MSLTDRGVIKPAPPEWGKFMYVTSMYVCMYVCMYVSLTHVCRTLVPEIHGCAPLLAHNARHLLIFTMYISFLLGNLPMYMRMRSG